MCSKFVVFICLVVSTLAVDPQEVNSYASYNENNNLVQQAQPAIFKVAASAAPVYTGHAPSIYPAPFVANVGSPEANYAAQSVYLGASASPVYSSPSLVNYAAPSPASYLNAAASPVYAVSPVTKVATVAYAAPAANYAPATVANYAAAPSYLSHHQDEYAHPKYEYAYSVEDHHTGDLHSQQEQRDGDHVVGQYSLREADGTIRIVKYYDDGHGFNAVVEKQGTPVTHQVALKKIIVPVASPHY